MLTILLSEHATPAHKPLQGALSLHDTRDAGLPRSRFHASSSSEAEAGGAADEPHRHAGEGYVGRQAGKGGQG